MSKSLDDIKRKVGIEALSEAERKKLFKKFVQAGGKVIEEKPQKKLSSFDREKQKELLKKMQEKSKTSALEKYTEAEDYEKAEEYDKKIHTKVTFWEKVSIYLKGIFNSTITLNGKYVNNKFFIFLEKEVIPNLQRLHLIVNEIFNSSENILNKVKENLYAKEKYYYELLQNYLKLYNEEEFNSILYFYRRNPHKKITPLYIKEPLKIIFKKIYILKDFVAGSFLAFKISIPIIYSAKRYDNEIVSRKLNYVKQALNIIFFQLLPKLYSLSLFILKANIPLNSKIFEEFLDIKEEEKIGYKSYKDIFKKEEKPLVKTFIEEVVKKQEFEYYKKNFIELNDEDLANLELDDLTKYGVKLIQAVNFEEIKSLCSPNLNLGVCDENDKVFITYILLKEFEMEYSFILTSYKIKINPEYIENKRMDYKEILNSIYPKLTPIYELFEEYFSIVNTLKEIKNDKLMSEIEKYNRITALESKRSKIGFEARNNTLNFLSEIKQYFDRFINDYNTEKKLIDNAEEVLHFDKEVEGEKKVENKKVIEAIIEADAFISAFIYRLEEGGDLSGISIEVKSIDIPRLITEESKEKKSFLDELSEVVKK